MATNLKILLLIAFAFLVGEKSVFGQNIYQQRSGLDYRFTEFTSVHTSDTGFFVLGWAVPLIPIDSVNGVLGDRRILMTWYDWNGIITKQKYFTVDSANYHGMWYSNNTIESNDFYHFGQLIDTTTTISPNNSDAALIKFNWEGDTIWTKRYNSGLFDVGTCGAIADNDDFIGVGYCYNGSGMFQKIIRFDSLGNIIWSKIYNSTFESYARYIVKGEGNNFYISGWTRPAGGGNPQNARTRIMKIDSAGNIIWNKPMPGICDEFACAIDLAQDGNLLVAKFDCIEQPGFTTIRSRVTLYKVSSATGDTIWHKSYPNQNYKSNNQPYFVRQLSNGDVLLGGYGIKLFIENDDTLFVKNTGELIRTDSLGNMKWLRQYFYNIQDAENISYNQINDGKETPEGGFILVGRTTHASEFNDGWIIKTDENGCIDASCVNEVEELEEDDFRLFIYPNPAQDYVSIDLPITFNIATLQIYNMQGQIIKSIAINGGGLQRIETTELPNGIYQLLVSSNTKLIGREKLVVIH